MPNRLIVDPETPTYRWNRDDFYLGYRKTAVYRLFAEDGTLLYVGITGNPVERMRRHAQKRPWWSAVDWIEFEVYETPRSARDAELVAIHTEAPVHNVMGVVRKAA